jgi:hypothetical protein
MYAPNILKLGDNPSLAIQMASYGSERFMVSGISYV